MSPFDEIDRLHLIDERDEARRDLRHARVALRRIASNDHALTAEEQRYAAIVGLSGETTDPAQLIARCAIAVTAGNEDDTDAEASSEDHRVEPCPTVELELNGRVERIDAGIAPLVQAMNRLPGVRTRFSCEGHPRSNFERWAWVAFDYRGLRLEIVVEPHQAAALTELVFNLAARPGKDTEEDEG
jgi:hypothetical protein